MYKVIVLAICIVLSGLGKAQTISSALHLNEEREYKTKTPKQIIITKTFYSTGGTQVDKSIQSFDEAGMLLSVESYDENRGIKTKVTYINDTVNRIKLSTTVLSTGRNSYSKESTVYGYNDKFFLISVTDKDEIDRPIRVSKIDCNEKGYPVMLSLFDGRGNSFGREMATYFYDQNKVVTSVITNDGRILNTDTVKINFRNAGQFAGVNETYNANGDLINWTRKHRNGTATMYEEEHTYDSFGNSTETKIYTITFKRNGKKQRNLDRVFKREYFYE